MLFWLLYQKLFLLYGKEYPIFGPLRLFGFVTFRTAFASLTALFLCLAVSAQALVFLFTTLAIDRERPAVKHLDVSPPTSSFPSGHTSAAFALYVGLAVVLAMLTHRTGLKVL